MMPQHWVGKTIGGRYQIEGLLGQGGMSAVYRATDPNLRRLVAIKMIHTHLSGDPNFVARFKEEAAAVARLRHPNIVQVHDFNVDGDTYYMVMEYLVGETLQARLKRLNASGRHMPIEEALRLCIQICEAAGYAHDHELIHRDIKPANIMINVNGQAVLMDFGIVKIVGGDYHTATGATIGTAMYMSPEQIRSERIDDRADIYSLGVTLYEMLSGQPPYMADSALTLMMMVLNDPLPDIQKVRTGIPNSLAAVVQKALVKAPAERFRTMAEMAAALRLVQLELASAPVTPSATISNEAEGEPTELATISKGSLEAETIASSQGSQPGTISAPGGQQPVLEVSSIPTLQDESLSATPAPAPVAETKTGKVTRSGSRRILFVVVGLVVLVVAIALGLFYINARKPPALQLEPISLPQEPVNVETAQLVVNLGRWETDSFIEELAFSPDGSLLGTANNRDWERFSQYRFYNGLWQVTDGSLQTYLLGHTQWIYDVAFSPDGELIGSASDDASVMLWQVSDSSLSRKIESERGGVTSLAFSPNNQLLAA